MCQWWMQVWQLEAAVVIKGEKPIARVGSCGHTDKSHIFEDRGLDMSWRERMRQG